MMNDELRESMTSGETWIRALYMLLFALIYSLAEIVFVAVVIIQFFFVLFTRETNERLLALGEDIGVFIYQIIQFQTFNSEEKPFPFAPWPYGSDEALERELAIRDVDEPTTSIDSADDDDMR